MRWNWSVAHGLPTHYTISTWWGGTEVLHMIYPHIAPLPHDEVKLKCCTWFAHTLPHDEVKLKCCTWFAHLITPLPHEHAYKKIVKNKSGKTPEFYYGYDYYYSYVNADLWFCLFWSKSGLHHLKEQKREGKERKKTTENTKCKQQTRKQNQTKLTEQVRR